MSKPILFLIFLCGMSCASELSSIREVFLRGQMEEAEHLFEIYMSDKKVMNRRECELKFDLEMGLCTKAYKERSQRGLIDICLPLIETKPPCQSKREFRNAKEKIKRWMTKLKLEAYIMDPYQPMNSAWRRRIVKKFGQRLK